VPSLSAARRFRPVPALLAGVERVAPRGRSTAQKLLLKRVYEVISRRFGETGTAFLNYGYAPLDEPVQDLGLSPEEERADRFGIQLYHRVAEAVDLDGLEVLEVGCGRGGGTAFVFDHHHPRRMVGLDLAPKAIAHCGAAHVRDGLTFVVGDAEALPFPDAEFDAVLNVESSHCYPDMPRFLAEVRRVLRPGGSLLFCDLRHTDLHGRQEVQIPRDDVPRLRAQIAACGMEVVEQEDLTADVVRALELDSDRRREMVAASAPAALREQLMDFAAVKGTNLFRAFAERDVTYLRYVLRKPAA
jgi:SAM-dependent methyltransferase